MSTFKWLSTIVDDVNNQTLLRHTQLIIEGTSKVRLESNNLKFIQKTYFYFNGKQFRRRVFRNDSIFGDIPDRHNYD